MLFSQGASDPRVGAEAPMRRNLMFSFIFEPGGAVLGSLKHSLLSPAAAPRTFIFLGNTETELLERAFFQNMAVSPPNPISTHVRFLQMSTFRKFQFPHKTMLSIPFIGFHIVLFWSGRKPKIARIGLGCWAASI